MKGKLKSYAHFLEHLEQIMKERPRDDVICMAEWMIDNDHAAEMDDLWDAHQQYESRHEMPRAQWSALRARYPRMDDDDPETGYHPETEEQSLSLRHEADKRQKIEDIVAALDAFAEEGEDDDD